MNDKTKTILEAVIDIVAMGVLGFLAWQKVVDASIIVPVISLIAAGSIGSRMGGKPSDPNGGGGTPASILLLGFTPILQMIGRALANRSSRAIVAVAMLVLFAGCGGGQQWQTSDAYRIAYRTAQWACRVAGALPAPADPATPTSGGEAAPTP